MYPIIASLLFTATFFPAPEAPEVLVATQPSINRGEVRTGSNLVQAFEVQHRGSTGTLVITDVKTPCGCMKPHVSVTLLRPQEKSIITVSVNTLTQPASQQTWRMKVRYHVTADATTPQPPSVQPDAELELKLSATLVQEITVTPPMIAMSTTRDAQQTVVVRDFRAKPFTIRGVTTTSPHMTATVASATLENGVQTIPVQVSLKESYPVGHADESVVLMTDDPLYPELRVPIRVVKRNAGAIVPSPESVEVRLAKSLEESSALLQLRAPNRGPLKIAKIDCDNPAIRTRFSPDSALAVTVRVIASREGARQQNGQATLHITFAEPAGETLAVPVSWILDR